MGEHDNKDTSHQIGLRFSHLVTAAAAATTVLRSVAAAAAVTGELLLLAATAVVAVAAAVTPGTRLRLLIADMQPEPWSVR